MMELHDLIHGKVKQVSLTLLVHVQWLWHLGTEILHWALRGAPGPGYNVSHWCSFVLSLTQPSSCCPASRWRLLTILCGCCSVFFSLAAMSRGRSSLRSSKVNRQHSRLPPPHSSGEFQENQFCCPNRWHHQFVQVAVWQTCGEEADDVWVRWLKLSSSPHSEVW